MAITLLAAGGFFALAPDTVIPFAPLFAVHSLAATRPPRVSLPGLAGLEALCALNFLTTNVGDTTFTMALAVGSWALGEAARNRRVAISEEARRAVSEEQARIARELHDVIAHSVSVIVVQAAAADDVFDERPDQARAALRSIEHAGATRWASCGGCSARCRQRIPAVRSPGSIGSTSSPRRCGRAGSTWSCAARASPRRCPPASTCPHTASCRRRSRTRCATRGRRAPRSS
jgi:Histidine kinase